MPKYTLEQALTGMGKTQNSNGTWTETDNEQAYHDYAVGAGQKEYNNSWDNYYKKTAKTNSRYAWNGFDTTGLPYKKYDTATGQYTDGKDNNSGMTEDERKKYEEWKQSAVERGVYQGDYQPNNNLQTVIDELNAEHDRQTKALEERNAKQQEFKQQYIDNMTAAVDREAPPKRQVESNGSVFQDIYAAPNNMYGDGSREKTAEEIRARADTAYENAFKEYLSTVVDPTDPRERAIADQYGRKAFDAALYDKTYDVGIPDSVSFAKRAGAKAGSSTDYYTEWKKQQDKKAEEQKKAEEERQDVINTRNKRLQEDWQYQDLRNGRLQKQNEKALEDERQNAIQNRIDVSNGLEDAYRDVKQEVADKKEQEAKEQTRLNQLINSYIIAMNNPNMTDELFAQTNNVTADDMFKIKSQIPSSALTAQQKGVNPEKVTFDYDKWKTQKDAQNRASISNGLDNAYSNLRNDVMDQRAKEESQKRVRELLDQYYLKQRQDQVFAGAQKDPNAAITEQSQPNYQQLLESIQEQNNVTEEQALQELFTELERQRMLGLTLGNNPMKGYVQNYGPNVIQNYGHR